MTTNPINGELGQRIEALCAERGDKVSIDEVAEVVASIMNTIHGDVTAVELRAYHELDDLARYIRDARAEIATMRPDEIRDEHLPAAPVAKEDMLQGPQLASEAKNQEEIDALLASMD